MSRLYTWDAAAFLSKFLGFNRGGERFVDYWVDLDVNLYGSCQAVAKIFAKNSGTGTKMAAAHCKCYVHLDLPITHFYVHLLDLIT